MVVTDADTGKVLATPEIGAGSDAAAFDPTEGLAFSSNGRDGTLTVVGEDAAHQFQPLTSVPTMPGARTMALDRKTHHLFLVTAKVQPPAAAQNPGRRSYVPGSFVILEYAP